MITLKDKRMNDLKNLKCLLPETRHLLLKMIDECDFLDKYVSIEFTKSVKKLAKKYRLIARDLAYLQHELTAGQL